MVGAGLSSVFQSLQRFRKGGLWVRQPGARQDPSFSRHYGYPLCDLRCECRLLPCPPIDLVSCRHRLWDSGCPLFWTREMHRWQLSTGNTEGLVCSRNVKAEPAASVWGSSSSEISSSAGVVSRWVYVWFFWCFLLCEPGRAETVDSWPVTCMLCLLRLCPGGWVHSFPSPQRALLLRLVWVPTCPFCLCFPAQECFEVTFGFEETCLGWRFDRLIAEMVCFYFTPGCAKTGAGPRL